MTEDEAKTKWCPFVRYLAIFRAEDGRRECAGSYNRGAQDSGISNAPCIGSACMAWRATDNEVGPSAPGHSEPEPKAAGFCGLAGQP